ncbi:lipase family protein [Archangium lansingense]|uniref:lipase family protein n=1 Tax=Archangium lansingense TaxID=2995310 RepID=UPI003B7A52C0
MELPNLNLCQQAFILSHESNYLGNANESGLPFALAFELAEHLNKAVFPNLGGKWSLAWGPVVYAPLGVPANAMYVAANPDRSAYFVAIAGTNFNALLGDVILEDNCVIGAIPWAQAFPSLGGCNGPSGFDTPHISQGTQLGVNTLLNMVDNLTQKSLVDFLCSVGSSSSKTLIFTGHSLGGALAPTLALALATSKGTRFSTTSWGQVHVLPTAGPTPGDENFSKLFQQVFPPVSLGLAQDYFAWNQNIWNSLDAVPHAWVTSMISEIPSLYPAPWVTGTTGVPPQPMPSGLQKQLEGATMSSLLFGINALSPFTMLPNIQVKGTFNEQYPITGNDSDALSAAFMAQVGYQHVDAYAKFFSVHEQVTSVAQEGIRQRSAGMMAAIKRMAEKPKRRAAVEDMIQRMDKKVRNAG